MEEERSKWVREYLDGASITEISQRHHVSRKSIYKWLERHEAYGEEGLRELSRAPHSCPATSELWCERIRAARHEHPQWGAPKLVWRLEQKYPHPAVPSISTVGRVLRESGLSRPRRRVRAHGTGALQEAEESNQCWAIDFKGWRRTGDGAHCEPLTLSDQATRYLLCCQALPSTASPRVEAVLRRVFAEYGLPQRIRSDNGSPFASRGECGLTRLSVWWTELGIAVERIAPGHPQQNGKHERMHRTLHEATMEPLARTLRQQQRRFDHFRLEYNEQRPHQALGQRTPASLYQPSLRPLPARIAEPDYRDWPQRRVCDGGKITWRPHCIFVSHALAGKVIGFEPLQDGVWRAWFYGLWLGVWEERAGRWWRPRAWTKQVERTPPNRTERLTAEGQRGPG